MEGEGTSLQLCKILLSAIFSNQRHVQFNGFENLPRRNRTGKLKLTATNMNFAEDVSKTQNPKKQKRAEGTQNVLAQKGTGLYRDVKCTGKKATKGWKFLID